jgi:molybdate transport system ATP-binding protein
VNAARGLRFRGGLRRGAFDLDLEFTVAAGETLGVLGPNGAGKSTLLRLLAGLEALGHGDITLSGRVLDDGEVVFVPAAARPVGLVFQNHRLFPHLTARDNVAFPARVRNVPRRQARADAEAWLHRLGIADCADRRPDALSGGQAQRVALARTLSADPELLLLDEPLASLDARTRLEVRGELRRHLADFRGPSIVVTHDPLEAMVMADRLLVIEGGRVVQHGAPAEVARRPATQYVARLVGLNLYAGTVSPGSTTVQLRGGGSVVAAADGAGAAGAGAAGAGAAEDAAPGERMAGRVLVAVRPTAIAVHVERPTRGSPRNVWPGVVTGMELLADRVRVQVHGTPPALVDVTVDAVRDLGLAAGTPVWLSAKATDVDVYPQGPGPAPS